MTTDLEPELLLTKKAIARAFGVSVRAVTDWKIAPAGKKGRALLYYLPEVLEYKLKSLEGSGSASLELTEERARLTHHQANMAELEEKKLKEELMDVKTVVTLCQGSLVAARNRILGIHSKIGSRFPGLDQEVINEIESLHYDALNQLGEDGIPPNLREKIGPVVARLCAEFGD